ncbi:MAG: type II toxin-antitoxin system PemK/MazF family toxin [bacterium]
MAGQLTRGSVHWIQLESKKRPGLILTREAGIPLLNHVTVVPTTTTIRDIPTEVKLTAEEGMPETCVLNCDHVVTVPKSRVKEKIMELEESQLAEVKSSLLFALGWDYQ